MVQRVQAAGFDVSIPGEQANMMPTIYRTMLIASAAVLITYGIEDGRDLIWGQVERWLMLVAGLCVVWSALRPSRGKNIAAGYLTTIAVLFEVVALFASRDYYRYPWVTASVLWIVFGMYTVALVSFQWVRKVHR